MNRLLIVLVLVLTSCNGIDRPRFEKMSESALATYNAGVADNNKVVCFGKREGWIGGSYRRIPNICLTVGEIIRNDGWEDWAGAGYGNSSGGYSQPADAADYHPGAFNGGHNFGAFRISINGVPL